MGVRAAIALTGLMIGCGASPNAPEPAGPLAGKTIRANGSSLIPDHSGKIERVPITHTWAFSDSFYAFSIDYPEPRHVFTTLPAGAPFYEAQGRYWLECDPGHARVCVLAVERSGGQGWDWREAAWDSVSADLWATDILIGEQVVRMGQFVYEVVEDD